MVEEPETPSQEQIQETETVVEKTVPFSQYQGVTRKVSDLEKENARLQQQAQLNESVKGDLQLVKEGLITVTEYLERQGTATEETTSLPQNLRQAMATQQQQTAQQETRKAYEQLEDIVADAGITDMNDLRMRGIKRLFNAGQYTAAINAAKEIANPPKPETSDVERETQIEAEVLKRFQVKLQAEGLATVETGGPGQSTTGRKPTLEELQAVTPKEYDAKVKSGEWTI